MKNAKLVIVNQSVIILFLLVISYAVNLPASNLIQAAVVISDTEFNTDDWSVEENSTHGASHTYRQGLTGGNPGAYLFIQHTLPPEASGNLGFIEVTYLYEAQEYDPSVQGAIDHIDYAEDIMLFSEYDIFRRSHPVIEQSGQI